MKNVFLISFLALAITLMSCSSEQNPQADPVTVAEAVFEAARSGDCKNLAILIDTDADNDCKRIGLAATDEEIRKSFIEYFAKGKVNGKPIVTDDKASVNIFFGREGTDEETFEMVKKEGKWYLQSF